MSRHAPAQSGDSRIAPERAQKWADALERMTAALRLLDEAGGPIDVGAHLDLAINRLREEIATNKSDQ